MLSGGLSLLDWVVLVQRELLLFASVFFLIGAIDEFAVDFVWLWLRLTGRGRTRIYDPVLPRGSSVRRAAVFIPAWREDRVIGATVQHMLRVWTDRDLRVYVGCYSNDPATIEAVAAAVGGDGRVRLVIHAAEGPTTKADCLNRLYAALEADEARRGMQASMVLLHDAEDMVDGAALALIDECMREADLVQLPVLPLPQAESRWIGGHYCDEFAENHGKVLVVRNALRAGIPLAGVGCGIARDALAHLAARRGGNAPFAAECLTEDYELGLGIADMGGRTRFVRRRSADGRLIATRAFFPALFGQAVRQKTRWVLGIAFQGWDRLGWSRRPVETWMRLRDRRGPFAALLLGIALTVLLLYGVCAATDHAGSNRGLALPAAIEAIVLVNIAAVLWRCAFRFGFTAREHGFGEGFRAVLRFPIANLIAVIAGRRALFAYVRSLYGVTPRWEKTDHHAHPALATRQVPR